MSSICAVGKIRNPATGRCVLISGKIGQLIVGSKKGGSGAKPAKPRAKSVKIQKKDVVVLNVDDSNDEGKQPSEFAEEAKILYRVLSHDQRFTKRVTILPPYSGIGAGSAGIVFKGLYEKKESCAVKVEPHWARDATVYREQIKLHALRKFAQQHGASSLDHVIHYLDWFPNIYDPSDTKLGGAVLILPFYAQPLSTLFEKLRQGEAIPSPASTFQHVAKEALTGVEQLARAGYIHNDLTPYNFMWKEAPTHGYLNCRLMLIDLGVAEEVNSKVLHEKIVATSKNIVGTPVYRSHRADLGFTPRSYRDDLEQIGYLLLQFHLLSESKGKRDLPWMDLFSENPNSKLHKERAAMKKKLFETGEGLPSTLRKYFEYIRPMKVQDFPDYSYLRSLF